MRGLLFGFSCFLTFLGAMSCGPSGFQSDAGLAEPRDGGEGQAADAGTLEDASTPGGGQDVNIPDAAASTLADASVLEDAFASSDASGVDADSGMVGIDAGPQRVSEIDHEFLIRHFGGNPVDATAFPDNESGFQDYLDAVGVTYFDAAEIVTPNHPEIAAMCGYMILLPEQGQWKKIGALALFADRLRALVGEPVWMRNWWRPDCYNTAVGGAPGGDHPDADAVDLDFLSASSRAVAQAYLCSEYWEHDIVAPEDIAPGAEFDPRLNMSIGLGEATIHLGVLSQNGRRYWLYSSYTDEANADDCW